MLKTVEEVLKKGVVHVEQPLVMLYRNTAPRVEQAAVGLPADIDFKPADVGMREIPSPDIIEIKVDVATFAQQRTLVKPRRALPFLQYGIKPPFAEKGVKLVKALVHMNVTAFDGIAFRRPAYKHRLWWKQAVRQILQSIEHQAGNGLLAGKTEKTLPRE